MKIILLIVGLILFSGCSVLEVSNIENRVADMTGYVGKSSEELVQALGYADSTINAPNGNEVYVYSMSKEQTSSVNCSTNNNGYQTCYGGDTTLSWCKDYFEIDKSKNVLKYSFKGNGCATCKSKSEWTCLNF